MKNYNSLNMYNNNNQNVLGANQVGEVNGEVQPKSAIEAMEVNNTNDLTANTEELVKTGYDLCVKGNYAEGAEYFKKAAELGNMEALYGLGFLYYEGKGVEKNLSEAARCFEIVAGNDCDYNIMAKHRLEKLANIESGEGIGIVESLCQFNISDPKSLWQKAAQGDLEAQETIANLIYMEVSNFNHPDADGETMMRYLLNLAEHDNAEAQSKLASVYIDGFFGVGLGKRNVNEGIKWARKAAENGHLEAQIWLTRLLYNGFPKEQIEPDREEAFKWLMMSAEQGFEPAQKMLGFPYTETEGQWGTTKETFLMFKKFANQGNPVAQTCLAYFYLYGECVKENRSTAFKWLNKARNQGYSPAQDEIEELFDFREPFVA